MKAHIVLGLGFGDEGKGLTTSHLCKTLESPLVIRFSGGQQCGHTVVDDKGNRHIFSNFGSGTLDNVPTYWSKYCTFHPNGLIREHEKLQSIGIKPRITVDKLAMVTTPFDILYNQAQESARSNRHGSCGVGIGTTVERNLTPYKLYAQDLAYPKIMEQKLDAIFTYYNNRVIAPPLDTILGIKIRDYWSQYDMKDAKEQFMIAAKKTLDIIELVQETLFFGDSAQGFLNYENLIFEGSQGILLDMDFGFFPNVTRANVTSKNAIKILVDNVNCLNSLEKIDTYYITRAYQTRHGAGYMTNEGMELNVKDNPLETNINNEWQSDFRKSILDIDLIKYAIECDSNYGYVTDNLVVTCLDQIDGKIQYTKDGELHEAENVLEIARLIEESDVDFNNIHTSYSDKSSELKTCVIY
jgi:adenylosuccinate synthase